MRGAGRRTATVIVNDKPKALPVIELTRTTLISRFGISADRLTSSGYGASAPKDTNDTSEDRARNRRVELVRQ